MNVLSAMEKQSQLLEMVSEAEESVTVDTEHEEGEIIDDDDDDFALERTPRKSSPVTSEVVIYDDHGRTAIFTSPKKIKSGHDPNSFLRGTEGVRRWARDDINKRREKDEGETKHPKDNDKGRRRQNAQYEIGELVVKKKNKRKQQKGGKVREGKKADNTIVEDHLTHKTKVHRDPPQRHIARHRKPSSSSDSESSTCSCSCSDEDDSSPRPQRGRGKENKRSGSLSGVRARSPLLSGSTRLTLQSSSSKQPPLFKSHSQKPSTKHISPHRSPPPQRKDVYRKSPPLHSSHKFAKDLSRSRTCSYPEYHSHTKQNKTVKRCNTLDDEKASFKDDQSSKEKTNDLVLLKGQKQPPPGSLGEMLLKKTMKGKLKVNPEAGESSVVTLDKDSELDKSATDKEIAVKEPSLDIGQECYTLDQEDEDELQLRLIALQSSLRVLSDVRKEGQLDMGLAEKPTCTIESKEEQGENLSRLACSNQLDRDKLPLMVTLENSLLQNELKESSLNTSEVLEQLCEGAKNSRKMDCVQYDKEDSVTFDQSNQVSTPNSPESEIEIEAIHTNKSYMGAVDSSNHLVGNTVENILGDNKELSDCNQDPVDMDICDSSAGEEDDDTVDEELFQEVRETISLNSKKPPATTVIVSDSLGNSIDNMKESTSVPESSQPSNFQVPVEWAYMMPPPPPPDQPVNDISNINSWCYDQNMYLQTMQAPYDSSEHYNHYNLQGVCSADWGQQQPQSPHWSCSANQDVENSMAEAAFELPRASTSEEGTRSNNDNVENTDVSKHTAEPQKDLKDLPAEQYQAFMSLVLKQQTAQPQSIKIDAPQRNLIEIPLLKNTNDTKHHRDQQNKQLVSKRSEARKRKRERQKKIKQVKKKQGIKKWGVRKLEPVVTGIKPQQVVDLATEEEDEDLLRAKLLIDLSKKKQQKAVESTAGHQVPVYVKETACTAKEEFENSPPHRIPSSSEASPVPQPHSGKAALLKSIHVLKSKIREGSPTQTNRVDIHPGLSDIGGFGLDPKSSRYDYPISNDLSTHSDVPKFKFPPIKPVIINLNSDSEEEAEESGMKNQTSERPKKEAESEASSIGMISSSIDHLLKAMRNAKPSGESKSTRENPESLGASSSSRLKSKAAGVDSTPSAVRHLSRTQQMEYHRLKEQLRKKELLHRRRQLQQQRPLAASTRLKPMTMSTHLVTFPESHKNTVKCSGSSTGATRPSLGGSRYNKLGSSSPEKDNDLALSEPEKYRGLSDSEGMSSSREVSWKEVGMLQIQLPNLGSDDHSSLTSVEDAYERGKNEHHIDNVNDSANPEECPRKIFTGEDEDEETLRKMVLQTLQKKISARVKTEKLPETLRDEENSQGLVIAPKDKYVADDTVVNQAATTLKVVIHQKVDEVKVNEALQEGSSDHCSVRKVVIEEQSKAENSKEATIHEGSQDEDISGEWMVLDEVLEEVSEGNGEDSEQSSTVGNMKRKTDHNKEDSLGVSCDSETNDDGHILFKKTGALFKNKACEKTIEKDKEIVGEDCPTVVCTSNLKDKQQDCLEISIAEKEEVQKQHVSILDGQKVCKESIICKDENIIINDTRNMKGISGLISNNKSEENQRQHSPRTCIPFSIKQLDTQHSGCNNEKEIKSRSLQYLSRQKNCKDEELASQKNKAVSSVRIKQQSHYESSTENPEKVISLCHKIGQEKEKNLGDDSEMNQSSVEIKTLCQNTKKPKQELKKGCTNRDIPQQGELLVNPEEQEETDLKGKGICVKRGGTDTNKMQVQASANDSTSISDFNHSADHGSSTKSGMCAGTVTAEGGLKTPEKVINVGNSEKAVKTKRLLILKKIEHNYSEKRTGMNKVISQLTSLVQEATEEERERQSLKKSVRQLSDQLKDMEAQLETKSRALKTKMTRIRALQTQLTTDRQFINELERKGKMLGQQEFGSSYTLPKVLGSPNSKTKDAIRKKQLASNINALRQQIRDVSNRSRARLEFAAQAEEIHEGVKRRDKVVKLMENSSKDPNQAEETGSQTIGVNSQSSNEIAVENIIQSEIAEDSITPKCSKKVSDNSKEVSNNSLKALKNVPLVGATASEINCNLTQEKPISSGQILTNYAKCDDVRGNIHHQEREDKAVDEVASSAAISTKMDKQYPETLTATSSNRVEDGEMLDEMNVLCPYDLLGRCNDDSCMYQHLAQRRNGSNYLMKPSASVTVKTGAHVLRSHLETRMEVDTGIVGRESESGVESMKLHSKMGWRDPDSEKEKIGPETGTGRASQDIRIGKAVLETRMGRMESNARSSSVEANIETRMLGSHTKTFGIKPDTRTNVNVPDSGTDKMEQDNGTSIIHPETGMVGVGPNTKPNIIQPDIVTHREKPEVETEIIPSDTDTSFYGPYTEIRLEADRRTGRVEPDTSIAGMGQDIRCGKMGQDSGNELENMTNTGKLGIIPNTEKEGTGQDTGGMMNVQDAGKEERSQNTETETLRPDNKLGSTGLNTNKLLRIETDGASGRTGPETRMRSRESADSKTKKAKLDECLESTDVDSEIERTEIDCGVGITGVETGVGRTGPSIVVGNVTERMIPAVNTQLMEDDDERGDDAMCENIPLSSRIENNCLIWENQAESGINTSSDLTTSNTYTHFSKKEVPSVVNRKNNHKRKRDNRDDLSNNSSICLSPEEEGDKARCKRTRRSNGEPNTGLCRPLAFENKSRVTNRNVHFTRRKKNGAKSLITTDSDAERVPKLNTVMVIDDENYAAKCMTDVHHVSTDVLADLIYTKDHESSLPADITCEMTLEVPKPELEGKGQEFYIIASEYEDENKKEEDNSMETISKKITLQDAEASEKPILEQPEEQQPQPNKFSLESSSFNTAGKKNRVKVNEKPDILAEPCKSFDSDINITSCKRPATRKMTKVSLGANFNEDDNNTFTEHVTTRRRGQELATRENRRGRSKGSIKIFAEGAQSSCSEDNDGNQCRPKRRTVLQKKNRGRKSVSRGRKK